MRPALLFLPILTILIRPGLAQPIAEPVEAQPRNMHPLALKEEMIRDRFQRFEDRVFRLREQLADREPENAARLGRVLQRAGELGLADQLDQLVERLKDPAGLPTALDAQAGWLTDADRLLAILLERDSENMERREEIERLAEYKKKLSDLLQQERGLRNATGQGSLAERMRGQLDQAIRRADALLERQRALSEQTNKSASSGEKRPGNAGKLADEQDALSSDTKQLAEDIKRLAELKPEANRDSADLESAREKTKSAAAAAQKSAGQMSGASESLQSNKSGSASSQQEQAEEALREAREQLEQAKKELDQGTDSQELSEQQKKIAQSTGELSDQMQQDSAAQSGQGSQKSQQGSPSSPPGQQNIQQAQQAMQDAAQSLDEGNTDEASRREDRAIDELEKAQQELEKALEQLRQEEREEVLRDLEVRFRNMLAKQRGINDGTVQLYQFGADKFTRGEHLKLADLSTRQRNLAKDAEVCRHILEEDGSTIVFPRVMEQLAEDMAIVADRLAAYKVATLTQTIEDEIIDTLGQLLEALQKMQEENEQQGQQQQQQGQDEQSPLLPQSAELKLLRASQARINSRTTAVATAREEESDTVESLADALRAVSVRQIECADIAEEMRAAQQGP